MSDRWRRVVRDLRLLLPRRIRAWGVGCYALAYLSHLLFFDALETLGGQPVQLRGIGGTIVTAFAFGVYRVAAFHPSYSPPHRAWLQLTPWTADKRLPLGPVRLGLADAVLLVGFCLVGRFLLPGPGEAAHVILGAFLLAYVLTLLRVVYSTRVGYPLGFGLGLLVLCPSTLAGTLLLCVLALLAMAGIEESLSAPPAATKSRQEVLKGDAIPAWPHGRMAPGSEPRPVPIAHRLFLPALVGWWGGLLVCVDPDEFSGTATLGLFMVTVFGPLARLWRYTQGTKPPLSLLGRILTGRLLIPSHDRVFVAPLLMFLVSQAVWARARWLELGPAVTLGLVFATVFYLGLNLGPSLAEWRLLGHHRLDPSLQVSVLTKSPAEQQAQIIRPGG